jgi:hypothetical protein
MPFQWNFAEQLQLIRYAVKWTVLCAPVAAAIGSA